VPRSAWNLLDPDVLAWHRADTLPPDFLSDLVELRRLIEPAAAEYAAKRGDTRRIADIGAALDAMRASVDEPDRFYAADVEFHLAIFAASGNVLIERLSTILGPLLEASFRAQMDVANDPETVVAIHDAVYDAIVDSDGPGARQAMADLLASATEVATRLGTARA
jgi:DNA-binding FadR family transcriptional regulator